MLIVTVFMNIPMFSLLIKTSLFGSLLFTLCLWSPLAALEVLESIAEGEGKSSATDTTGHFRKG